MKRLLVLSSLLASQYAMAGQCQFELQNEIHLNDQVLTIQQTSGGSASIDGDNNLFIHGEKIELDADQQAAIQAYRNQLNDYLPKLKAMTVEGLALANEIIDDVATSFDMPDAFDDVKASMKSYFEALEEKYYQGNDFVIPADSLSNLSQGWLEDLERAKDLFTSEFIGSAFQAMSEKMKQDGGLNLTELADNMAELKAKIAERLKAHESEIQKQSDSMCDSLEELSEQESELHSIIPQLKEYQLFTI
ncbi:YggN family protein [Vibrio sonorensis]|uniref:YggN family protein n=1 Tax=Vibrio sonorensis TaxID=1004316 RepID=UPI0008D8DB33|nr:YggN family protein [Vibrio sonorensis]